MDEEKTTWKYKPDDDSVAPDDSDSSDAKQPKAHHSHKSISWEAPEYIDHHHGATWYALLFIITLAVATMVYFVIKDAFAAVIVVILGIIVGIFATQKPSQAEYELASSGLSINGKLYAYDNYKSFALIDEGKFNSVNLFPIKRFMPPLSAYFNPKDQKKIIETIGDYLPYEQRQLDGVERLARRLRL